MLEVHPPAHTPHTWRDFFIHIATIVVGLLIAVGLEQAVEWLHHRHQIAETREALAHERALNARISTVLLEEFRRITPKLQTNLAVFAYLRDHPRAPETTWPGKISWDGLSIKYVYSAWKTAQDSNILALMPPREVEHYSELYSRIEDAESSYRAFNEAKGHAAVYIFVQPDAAKLSPAKIADEIDRVGEVLASLARRGRTLNTLQLRFSDFAAPSNDELDRIAPVSGSIEDRKQTATLAKRIRDMKDAALVEGRY